MSTRRTTKIAAGAAAVAAVALGGAALANAQHGDSNRPLEGQVAAKAASAALAAVGGGKVQASEYDTEKGATYEVEVRKTNGSTVDVRLDQAYGVVAIDGDSEDRGADKADSGTGEH